MVIASSAAAVMWRDAGVTIHARIGAIPVLAASFLYFTRTCPVSRGPGRMPKKECAQQILEFWHVVWLDNDAAGFSTTKIEILQDDCETIDYVPFGSIFYCFFPRVNLL